MTNTPVDLSPSQLYLLMILYQCEIQHDLRVTPSAVLMALHLWRKQHPGVTDPLLRLKKDEGAQTALNLLMAKLISEGLVARAEPVRYCKDRGRELVHALVPDAEQTEMIVEVARCRLVELKHTSTAAPSHSRPLAKGGTT